MFGGTRHINTDKDGRFDLQELITGHYHTRANLRFNMQFELPVRGNEHRDAKHHRNYWAMTCFKDEFILQKNTAKINRQDSKRFLTGLN